MKTRTLKALLLYNYRYWFGYSIIIGFIVYFLGWRIGSIPNGLSAAEITTAARSVTLGSFLELPIHPLHSFLQWASISAFGVTTWSVRLGGLIIGLLTALALYILLKKWFGKPTALLSTAIFISADWFLFIARLGTGAIEFSFWLCLALICYMKLLEKKTWWLLLFSLALVGLLFSPFGIYAVITFVAGLLGSRVFRARTNEASRVIKTGAGALLFIAFVVIGYVSTKNIAFLQNLLGIQSLPSISGYFMNVIGNLTSVVAVLPNSNPTISPTGVFFVRFFEFVFILFGVIMLWRTRVNRLNLIVLLVSVVLVLASGLSDGSRGSGLALVPAAIFMTAGIRHFIHRWQRTFPRNPYSRIVAYVPLTILFAGVVALHFASYFILWPTQSSTHQAFQKDILLASQELKRDIYQEKECAVLTENAGTQTLIAHSKPTCKIVFFDDQTEPNNTAAIALVPPESSFAQEHTTLAARALTSEATENNVRWLVIPISSKDTQ